MSDWPAPDPGIAEAARVQGKEVARQVLRDVIATDVPRYPFASAEELIDDVLPVMVDELSTRLVMTVRDEPEVIRDEC